MAYANLEFDENGFVLDNPALKKWAEEHGISTEAAEVKLRQAMHHFAELLRKQGMDVPNAPKEEMEFLGTLLDKHKDLFKRR